MTTAPDGAWIFGVNQAERPRFRSVQVAKTGDVSAFPNEKMSADGGTSPTPLDAVEGVQSDDKGIIWILDNGRRSETTPKVLAWNFDKAKLNLVLNLAAPAIVPGSFLADLAVDPEAPFIYISDPANGPNAALIVLDRVSGIARRVLQGHGSMVPDAGVPLLTNLGTVERKRLDGTATLPHCGINALTLDRKAAWLYFTPVQSHRVCRVPTALLRNPDVTAEKLAAAVEIYAEHSVPTTSMTIDNKGNLYLGDIEGRGVGVVDAKDRSYRVLMSDARFIWPDGLCFGPDGLLYLFSRTQPATAVGTTISRTPVVEHSMFRMKPLAPGRVGD
jgi:sugar lactone lactonase YvrE